MTTVRRNGKLERPAHPKKYKGIRLADWTEHETLSLDSVKKKEGDRLEKSLDKAVNQDKT